MTVSVVLPVLSSIEKKCFLSLFPPPTGGNVPNTLHQVSVPIMNNTKCQELFTKSGHVKRVRTSFLCAGYENGQKDSCEVSPPPHKDIVLINKNWEDNCVV